MTISVSDIKIVNSSGGLGGALTTEITSGVLNNLFDNVSGKEAKDGDIEYRCFYVKNSSTTDTLYDAVVYLESNVSDTKQTIFLGLGTSSQNNIEQAISSESDTPIGVTFSELVGLGNGISIGDLAPSAYKSFWLKREVLANAGVNPSNSFSVGITGNIY